MVDMTKRKGKQKDVPVVSHYTLVNGVPVPKDVFEAWDPQDWDLFNQALDALTDEKLVDEVWAHVEAQDSVLKGETEAESVTKEHELKIHSMTDAEYREFIDAIEGWDTEITGTKPTLTVVSDKDHGKKCNCGGPGSTSNKWPTHLTACPMYPDPKTKVNPVCDCNGPGSKDQKFSTHSTMCPVYKAATGSYSSKASCKHNRDTVELDNGLTILASGSSDIGNSFDDRVQFGVYFDGGWKWRMGEAKPKVYATPGVEMPWLVNNEAPVNLHHPYMCLDWPDRKVPTLQLAETNGLVDWMLDTIAKGTVIEIGCIGGHGRTGTMLSLLLAAQGHNPLDAVQRVWDTYCINAVESLEQTDLIVQLYESRFGKEWKTKANRKAWKKLLDKNFTKPAPHTYNYQGKPQPGGYVPPAPAGTTPATGKGGGSTPPAPALPPVVPPLGAGGTPPNHQTPKGGEAT